MEWPFCTYTFVKGPYLTLGDGPHQLYAQLHAQWPFCTHSYTKGDYHVSGAQSNLLVYRLIFVALTPMSRVTTTHLVKTDLFVLTLYPTHVSVLISGERSSPSTCSNQIVDIFQVWWSNFFALNTWWWVPTTQQPYLSCTLTLQT